MIIRKATKNDIQSVADIYTEVQTAEEEGRLYVGWKKGIYPTACDAEKALARDDLFVMEDGGKIVATAIINQIQVDVYENAAWQHKASPKEVMVLHTLAVSTSAARRGYGRAFVDFYEEYALENGCRNLRMDTNEKNLIARAMYKKYGYSEIGIVPCVFNGLPNVNLVLLEKYLS